jgi:hypothetical protein
MLLADFSMKLEANKLLLDVTEACRDVEHFTAQTTLDDYLASELLRAATLSAAENRRVLFEGHGD